MKKDRKAKTKEKTIDNTSIETTKIVEDVILNEVIKNSLNEVIENKTPNNIVTEIKLVEKINTITAKIDRCFNNKINNRFLTKDKEYTILNSSDTSFTIINDQGIQHCFLYADAKDLFYL